MHVTEMGIGKGLQMVLSYSLEEIMEEVTQLRKLILMVELPKVNDDNQLKIRKGTRRGIDKILFAESQTRHKS